MVARTTRGCSRTGCGRARPSDLAGAKRHADEPALRPPGDADAALAVHHRRAAEGDDERRPPAAPGSVDQRPSRRMLQALADLEMRWGWSPTRARTFDTLRHALPFRPLPLPSSPSSKLLNGDPLRADSLYSRLVESQPGQVSSLTNRGLARMLHGNWAGAEADFAASMALAPDNRRHRAQPRRLPRADRPWRRGGPRCTRASRRRAARVRRRQSVQPPPPRPVPVRTGHAATRFTLARGALADAADDGEATTPPRSSRRSARSPTRRSRVRVARSSWASATAGSLLPWFDGARRPRVRWRWRRTHDHVLLSVSRRRARARDPLGRVRDDPKCCAASGAACVSRAGSTCPRGASGARSRAGSKTPRAARSDAGFLRTTISPCCCSRRLGVRLIVAFACSRWRRIGGGEAPRAFTTLLLHERRDVLHARLRRHHAHDGGRPRASGVRSPARASAFSAPSSATRPRCNGAFAQRELEISLMDARAGSPPTAAEFLRRTPPTGSGALCDDLLAAGSAGPGAVARDAHLVSAARLLPLPARQPVVGSRRSSRSSI